MTGSPGRWLDRLRLAPWRSGSNCFGSVDRSVRRSEEGGSCFWEVLGGGFRGSTHLLNPLVSRCAGGGLWRFLA